MLSVERLGVVLQPRDKDHAKFNPGMILQGDTVHMVYRWAKTDPRNPGTKRSHNYEQDFVSYARLTPDGKLVTDLDDKGFIRFESADPRHPIFTQDPRIVEFEGEYIIFYTYWDLNIARVGMSRTKDFKTVEPIGVIPTQEWDKDAFILPERINGKIVYIHRIEPNIQIDYFDTFEDMLDPAYWADYKSRIHEKVVITGAYPWENMKVGGSIPPIRTEMGWLFLYHGVANDRTPFCYRAGAAMLDLENPNKVIARLPYPILEPVTEYERHGDVDEVVFPQGAYLHDGWLYMSYGGADKVVAMCRCRLKELLDELKKNLVQN